MYTSDGHIRLLVSEEEIKGHVLRIAAGIREDFRGKRPVLIGVLKGAFVFLSDLVRAIDSEIEVDFIHASSYVSGMTGGEVRITGDVSTAIAGKDVIIVEGIVDQGRTARSIIEHLSKKSPASISFCSLLKRGGLASDIRIDYLGQEIADGFVVGYGMDLRGMYRNLPGVYVVHGQP